jgi:chromosome segregation ATPase
MVRTIVFALALTASGCSSMYYAGLEKVGIPKRDLLERRVERARDAQEETKEQFSSALERFRATVKIEPSELEQRYDELRGQLEKSEARADELKERIDEVEDVAEALFREWEDELDDYKRNELRDASARRLAETKRNYTPMMAAMRRAHGRIDPVLSAFRDVVLALKHQLNAKAVAGIRGELVTVEREVDALVEAMNRSIREASRFLGTLEQPSES